MSGPIYPMPIDQLQHLVGCSIETHKSEWDPSALRIWLSIAEYLKDAKRWQYVETHYIEVLDADMGEMVPEQFKKWVDDRVMK